MANLTKHLVLGDLLKWIAHPGYCLVAGTFKNAGAVSVDYSGMLGMPVKLSGGFYVPVLATDEDNAEGLLVVTEDFTLAASGTKKVSVLVRGPAIVHEQALPVNDVDGDALTWATIKTALPDIVFTTAAAQESEG